MSLKTIDSYDLNGKRVLLRLDLNSDVKNGKIISSERIKDSAITVQKLKEMNAKIVILAHQGNPGKDDFLSLRQHAIALSKYTNVGFVNDVIGSKAISKINGLRNGEAILLDNVRLIDDEFEPDKRENKLLDVLSPLFDYYINDAFPVLHRSQTSVCGFNKRLKSMAGPFVVSELKALEKIKLKNCLYILGGAKPESDIKLLGKNKTIVGGLFGQMCLVSRGKMLGFQNDFLKKATLLKQDYDEFLKKLKKKSSKAITPIDFAVEKDKRRKELDLREFPNNYEIKDIGSKTIELFSKEIRKAKAVYMKGPVGMSDDKRFSNGTISLLKVIAESKVYSVIGGGHLSDTIKASKIRKEKFNHISTSGGALLEFIAGSRLPGLVALGYYRKK